MTEDIKSTTKMNKEKNMLNQSNTKPNRVRIWAKVSDSWSHEDIVKFIAEVKARPCIWNVADGDYKNRVKRDIAWQEILILLDKKFPVDQLQCKWQCLRAQFRNSLAAGRKPKSGKWLTKKVVWKYLTRMFFIASTEKLENISSESNMSTEYNKKYESSEAESIEFGNVEVNKRKRKTSTDVNLDGETSNKGSEDVDVPAIKIATNHCCFQSKSTPDDIAVFGNFFITELRKIKGEAYRQRAQRHLLQVLWDFIENEPSSSTVDEIPTWQ